MRRVRFNVTRVVEDARKGTQDEERYEAGRVYELNDASAARWVNRGVAEYADGGTVPGPQPGAPASPDAQTSRGPVARSAKPRAKPAV